MSLPSRERGLKCSRSPPNRSDDESLPSRERGLKSNYDVTISKKPDVAPLAGAWIEMAKAVITQEGRPSLPSRERGLKWLCRRIRTGNHEVAPLAGAWIEIADRKEDVKAIHVAPLAGAWIEIAVSPSKPQTFRVAPLAGAWIEIVSVVADIAKRIASLPSRERGLKYLVVPVVQWLQSLRRSPRGSVD